MFNALWFHPDGGAEQYAQYGAAVSPMLAKLGGQLLFPTMAVETSLEGGLNPDLIAFVRYPSLEAHDALRNADDYAPLGRLRRKAISKAIATRCDLEPLDAEPTMDLPAGIAVLNALWFSSGGESVYEKYLSMSGPLVHEHGGHFVGPRLRPLTEFGAEFLPHLMFLGYYPSVEALNDLITSDDYKPAAAIRSQALHRSAATILRISP